MTNPQLTTLQEQIEGRLGDAEPTVEVLALEPSGPESLRLFIDSPDGVSLALCERVTGHLRELLTDWSLEVSSPGPERPLSRPEHFRRFVGRQVRVRTREEIAGRRSFTGRLAEADDRQVRVESADGTVAIPLELVRRSNLLAEPDGDRELRSEDNRPPANREVTA